MRYVIVSLLSALSCCSPGEGKDYYFWGEAVSEVAQAYCDAGVRCGFLTPKEGEECERHVRFHECELPNTCGISIPDKVIPLTEQCVDQLYDRSETQESCYLLGLYQVFPEVCYLVMSYDPGDKPDAGVN